MPILEDVAERQAGIDTQRRGLIRRDLRAYDQVQQSPQQREKDIAEANRTARAQRPAGWCLWRWRFRAGSAALLVVHVGRCRAFRRR